MVECAQRRERNERTLYWSIRVQVNIRVDLTYQEEQTTDSGLEARD